MSFPQNHPRFALVSIHKLHEDEGFRHTLWSFKEEWHLPNLFGTGEEAVGVEASVQSSRINMAYKRSITSSESSHDTIPHVSISSDSDYSYQSGTSGKCRRMHTNCSRIQNRLPQYPSTPEDSSEDNKENRHPAEDEPEEDEPGSEEEEPEEDEPEEEEPEEDEPHFEPYVPAVGHLQQPPEDELQSVLDRFEARGSRTSGPDGFGAGSSLAAQLQHELTIANLRLAAMEASEAVNRVYDVMNAELADRLAGAGVDRVMMGIAAEESARIMTWLWMGVATLIVLVLALLLRGW